MKNLDTNIAEVIREIEHMQLELWEGDKCKNAYVLSYAINCLYKYGEMLKEGCQA